MNGGMHPQTRNQMLQQQQQHQHQQHHRMPQYGNNMMYGSQPGVVMMPQQQQQQPQQQTIGVRRSAQHLNAPTGMHPEEPAGKRYRKVISNVRPWLALLSNSHLLLSTALACKSAFDLHSWHLGVPMNGTTAVLTIPRHFGQGNIKRNAERLHSQHMHESI